MLGLTGLKDNTEPIQEYLVARLLAAMQHNNIGDMNDVFRNINIAAVRRSELGGGRGKRSIKHKNIKTHNKRKQQAITRTTK